MKKIEICSFLFLYNFVSSHHFRGGSFSSSWVKKLSNGSNLIELKTMFTWDLNEYNCDEDIIEKRSLIGPYNEFLYSKKSKLTSSEIYCEKYSLEDNWSYGKRRNIYSINDSTFEVNFESCCWSNFNEGSFNYQMKRKMNLNEPNDSPIMSISPIGTLKRPPYSFCFKESRLFCVFV
jgi:hypothetical protein